MFGDAELSNEMHLRLITALRRKYPEVSENAQCCLTGRPEDLALNHRHKTLRLRGWLWEPVDRCHLVRLWHNERCSRNLAEPTPAIQKFIRLDQVESMAILRVCTGPVAQTLRVQHPELPLESYVQPRSDHDVRRLKAA